MILGRTEEAFQKHAEGRQARYEPMAGALNPGTGHSHRGSLRLNQRGNGAPVGPIRRMRTLKPLCFILMPFGRKSNPAGAVIDFDRVYAELTAPP